MQHAPEQTVVPTPSASIAPSRTSLWRDIRDAIRGAEHDYTEGAIGRAIFLLAVPMVLEMSMESIFAVVDAWYVGHLGPAAVASIGLTESLMVVIYTVAMGLSIGVTATVSRRIAGTAKGRIDEKQQEHSTVRTQRDAREPGAHAKDVVVGAHERE